MTIRDVVSASGTFAANNGTSKQKRFSFLYDMDIISINFRTGNTVSLLTFFIGENTTRMSFAFNINSITFSAYLM